MLTSATSPVLIGDSAAVSELRHTVERVARSDAKVLITGESGSGKELVAHSLHDSSPRSSLPFVTVNCAGLPDGLLESELFGHVKGSFTGAYRDKTGKFEAANGGTMLLDEVGEMSLRMQGLLLRFLQTGELQKVGADLAPTRVNVRVVASTNKELRKLSDEGKFRQDLFYRLNVIHVEVPPLRERREDIPPLAAHFLDKYATHHSCVVRDISHDAMEMLSAYHWPGNVRELRNVVERLALTAPAETVAPEHLPADIRRPATPMKQPFLERRRTVADDLYRRMVDDRQSFWMAVYPLYLQRDITRGNIRDLVRKGLEESRGNYKIVARIFNLEQREYKTFPQFSSKEQLPASIQGIQVAHAGSSHVHHRGNGCRRHRRFVRAEPGVIGCAAGPGSAAAEACRAGAGATCSGAGAACSAKGAACSATGAACSGTGGCDGWRAAAAGLSHWTRGRADRAVP